MECHPRFLDRFGLGEQPEDHGSQFFPGRWQYVGSQTIRSNDAALQQKEYLALCDSGHCKVEHGEDEPLSFVLPSQFQQLESGIELLVKFEGASPLADAKLEDWILYPPFVPDVGDYMKELEAETKIFAQLPKLTKVCDRPRDRLEIKEERVHISRARKIAHRAVEHLSYHTEDWQMALIGGVHPKRILAEVRYENLDLYENRISVIVADRLHLYLGRRIRELEQLVKEMDHKDHSKDAQDATRYRQNRIYALWGEIFEGVERSGVGHPLVAHFRSVYRKVKKLKGSRLLKNLRVSKNRYREIRPTNIFLHDQDYRGVKRIWHSLIQLLGQSERSPDEIKTTSQKMIQGMDKLTLVHVLRSLNHLQFDPLALPGETEMAPGTKIKLESPICKIDFQWCKSGEVLLESEDVRIRVVGVPVSVDSEKLGRDATYLRSALKDNSTGRNEHLVILHLSDQGSADAKQGEGLGYRLDKELDFSGGSVSWIPVSLIDLSCGERVLRALRWLIHGPLYMAFPAKIPIRRKVHDLLSKMSFPGPEWMIHDEEKATILRPPGDNQWDAFKLSFNRIREREKNVIKSKKSGDADQLKKDCDKFLKDLEDKIKQVSKLESCPICSATGRFLERAGEETYKFECQSCNTIWGTELCPKGHRYPSLLPSGKPPDPAGDIDHPESWLDQRYGGDLLSDLDLSGKGGFCCPTCDQVQM